MECDTVSLKSYKDTDVANNIDCSMDSSSHGVDGDADLQSSGTTDETRMSRLPQTSSSEVFVANDWQCMKRPEGVFIIDHSYTKKYSKNLKVSSCFMLISDLSLLECDVRIFFWLPIS
jgi:hypothetical protein